MKTRAGSTRKNVRQNKRGASRPLCHTFFGVLVLLLLGFAALFAFAAFAHGAEAFLATLGAIGRALHQLGTDQLDHYLLRAIAFTPTQLDDPGISAIALTETGAQLIEQLLDGVLRPQERGSLTTGVQACPAWRA